MEYCRREIRSDSPAEIVIMDTGKLKAAGPVAFHLHAPWPFRIDDKRIVLEHAGIALEIVADWAESASQREELIDYKFDPVYHLVLLSKTLRDFALRTLVRRR